MDENSPVFENFLNKMAGSMPIRGTTRRVSASKFLGKDDLQTQVENNSKKITILRRIISARRIRTGENISKLSQTTSTANIEAIVKDLVKVTTTITETLKDQEKINQEMYARSLRIEERERRRRREEKLEGPMRGIRKVFGKVMKPIMSVFERVAQFLFNVIAGRFFQFLIDPKNKNFIQGLLGFFKNFYPALIAGFLLFGNSIGRLITRITITVISKLPALSRLLLSLARRNPIVFGLASAAVIGGGFLLNRALNNPEVDDQGLPVDNRPDAAKGETETETETGVETESGFDRLSTTTPTFTDANEGFTPVAEKFFNTGGYVRGPGGIDKVPARLTAGEFVMSKGAVQRYGVGTLSAMNSAGGGTNRPMGVNFYNGGPVMNYMGGDPNYVKIGSQTTNNFEIGAPIRKSASPQMFPPISQSYGDDEPSEQRKVFDVAKFNPNALRDGNKVSTLGITV